MIINVFGFQFETEKNRPEQFTKTFEGLAKKSGEWIQNKTVAWAVADLPFGTQKEHWWAGVVIKSREGKLLPMLHENVITAKDLSGEGRIADPAFFIAHKKTGRGLYSTHRGAASINFFGGILMNQHRAMQEQSRKNVQEDDSLTPKERKSRLAELRDTLVFEQLVKQEDFPELVAEFKKAKEVTLKVVHLGSNSWVDRLKAFSSRTTVHLPMEDEVNPEELARAFRDLLGNNATQGDVIQASVKGSRDGVDSTVKTTGTVGKFSQYDYDKEIEHLKIDFGDLVTSIRNSSMIQKLFSETLKNKTKAILLA